jgi:hypothetical protein
MINFFSKKSKILISNEYLFQNKNKCETSEKTKEKACGIYKTSESYKIVTQSHSDTGLLLEDEPVFILPLTIDITVLCEKIFISLNSGRNNLPMPNKENLKKWLQIINEKSFNNLYKTSTHCDIRWYEDTIKICPSMYEPKYKSLVPVEKDTIELKYSETTELEITQAIINPHCNSFVELS